MNTSQSTPTGDALGDIAWERRRQTELRNAGRYEKTCADDMPNLRRLAVLTEEVGEFAQEVLTFEGFREARGTGGTYDSLYKEALHVAAVATAILEGIVADAQRETRERQVKA